MTVQLTCILMAVFHFLFCKACPSVRHLQHFEILNEFFLLVAAGVFEAIPNR